MRFLLNFASFIPMTFGPGKGACLGTLHRLIETLNDALAALRAGTALPAPDDAAIERIALVIHDAMTQSARTYHSIEHALSVARADCPIERVAGLFHDVVYLQIDRGIAPSVRDVLGIKVASDPWGITSFARAPLTAAERRCLALFGGADWQSLATDKGLNEALSALTATRLLDGLIPSDSLLAVQGAIEATIPFRGDAALETLRGRLHTQDGADSLGAGSEKISGFIESAARLANRDVESFAAASAADFLASTWLLFTELDPTLSRGRAYNVRTYRRALHAMERFLSVRLDPKRIFLSAGEADRKVTDTLRQQARFNLSNAIIYMRVKLFPIALLEAIAECTGGDAPLEMFLGDPRDEGSVATWATRELDAQKASGFQPQVHYEATVDAEIFQLLWVGRSGHTSFDLPNSPVGALLYANYGGPFLVDAYDRALAFFDGKMGALPFLKSVDPRIVMPLAQRIAANAATRRKAMTSLMGLLRQAA